MVIKQTHSAQRPDSSSTYLNRGLSVLDRPVDQLVPDYASAGRLLSALHVILGGRSGCLSAKQKVWLVARHIVAASIAPRFELFASFQNGPGAKATVVDRRLRWRGRLQRIHH